MRLDYKVKFRNFRDFMELRNILASRSKLMKNPKAKFYNCFGECYIGDSGKYKTETQEVSFQPLYLIEFNTLYIDLLTLCNKTFGKNYDIKPVFPREYCIGKKHSCYNISIEQGWDIYSVYGDYYTFNHSYTYENDPQLGICQSTYGEWYKDDLIALADALESFFKQNPLLIAYKAMKEKYDFDDKLNIRYKKEDWYNSLARSL